MMDAEKCRRCGADGDAGCACGPGRVAPWPHTSAMVTEGDTTAERSRRSLRALLREDTPAGRAAADRLTVGLRLRWMNPPRVTLTPYTAFTTTPAGRLVLVTPPRS